MTLCGYRGSCCDDTKKMVARQSADILKKKIGELVWQYQGMELEAYDDWLASTCDALIKVWDQHFSLTLGQAQAWVNNVLMLYAAISPYSLGLAYANYLQLFHVPLNCKIYRLMELGWDVSYEGVPVHVWYFNRQLPAWSVIDDQKTYMEVQKLWRAIAADHHRAPCEIAVAACWLRSQQKNVPIILGGQTHDL